MSSKHSKDEQSFIQKVEALKSMLDDFDLCKMIDTQMPQQSSYLESIFNQLLSLVHKNDTIDKEDVFKSLGKLKSEFVVDSPAKNTNVKIEDFQAQLTIFDDDLSDKVDKDIEPIKQIISSNSNIKKINSHLTKIRRIINKLDKRNSDAMDVINLFEEMEEAIKNYIVLHDVIQRVAIICDEAPNMIETNPEKEEEKIISDPHKQYHVEWTVSQQSKAVAPQETKRKLRVSQDSIERNSHLAPYIRLLQLQKENIRLKQSIKRKNVEVVPEEALEAIELNQSLKERKDFLMRELARLKNGL